MRIFSEETPNLLNYTAKFRRQLIGHVEEQTDNYIMSVNETQYIEFLVNTSTVEHLLIDFESRTASVGEKMVPAENFPGGSFSFNVYAGKSYKKRTAIYHIPFSGNRNLLKYRPNSFYDPLPEYKIVDGNIEIEIVDFYGDVERVKIEANNILGAMKATLQNVIEQVEYFNKSLERIAKEAIQIRKKAITEKNDFLSSLGVPLKKSDNTIQTLVVPVVQRKIIVKPIAPSTAFKPEPTLSDSNYQEIIGLLMGLGKGMEVKPSTYENKDEEALRDVFLLPLELQFDSATGETFNKKGKTDILLRYEQKNVFVAECKIWKGEVVYTSAINQLLGYLTWRDSKAALMVFVKNKEITPVLDQIQPITEKHPCFVKYKGNPSDGRYNFDFHLPGDQSRSVQLAVLVFHFV